MGDFKRPEGQQQGESGMLKIFLKNWMLLKNGFMMKKRKLSIILRMVLCRPR